MNQQNNMWQWNDAFEESILPKYQIILQEGFTPLQKTGETIAKMTPCEIYFKREDLNPTGSFKFRSLSYQIALAAQQGHKAVIVPTSGNAGIAAAIVGKKLDIQVYTFISPHIDKTKLEELKKRGANVIISHDSIRLANRMSIQEDIPNLRSSTHDSAIEGYKSLAGEIDEQLPECDAIFTYVTSGSSLIGMGKMFHTCKNIPELHAVQSGNVTSIASEFDTRDTQEEQKAGKGGIKNTRRKEQILQTIRSTKGFGWIVSNQEIEDAKELLEQDNIDTSYESCASLAATLRAAQSGKYQKIAVIFSGKNWLPDLKPSP